MLRQGASVLAAGLLLGLGVAAGATRLLATQLFGVGPTDPWTFAAVALLLALVCLGATLVPAMRATHADPMTALRTE